MKYCRKTMGSLEAVLLMALVTMVVAAPNPYDQCSRLLHIDCATSYVAEPNEVVCCSDGNTYQNLCFFAQAKCSDFQLVVQHTGHCKSTTATPVDMTTPSTTGQTGSTNDPTLDIIHFVFCSNDDQIACDDTLDPVCGSDNLFYKNDCVFAKAKCNNPNLTTLDLHVCKTANRRVRRLTVLV